MAMLAIAGAMAAAGAASAASSKSSTSQVSTLSKSQQVLHGMMGRELYNQIGRGVDPYPGELSAPLTTEQVLQRAKLGELMSSGILSLDQNSSNNLFSQAVQNPMIKTWNESLLPSLRDRYAQQGALWSGRRARSEGQAASDLASQLTSARAQWAQTEQQNLLARNAAFAGLVAPYQSYEQQVLDRKFNEYQRTRPENNPWLQYVIPQQNVQSVALQQGGMSPWLGALQGGLSGFGAYGLMNGFGGASNTLKAPTPAALSGNPFQF